jgi:hypothetical protein
MSPEQARGTKNVGPAADIYSLGAILYELLTGRPPFLGESTVETLLRVTREEPAAPRSLNSSIPRDLETICLTCLAKSPNRRYASASELADDLGRFLAGKSVTVRAPSSWERVTRWSKERKSLLYLCVGAATAAAVAAVVFLVNLLWPPPPVTQSATPTGANLDEARARVEEARDRMLVSNNRKQIALAFHNYADANLGKLPLAAWSTRLDNKQYRLKAGDTLQLSGMNVFESAPINGTYPVGAGGTIDVGPEYGGIISVSGLTLAESQAAVQAKVRANAKAAVIAASFARSSLLSWRVAMLPYLEQDVLYRQFKLDEAWDSENNTKLIASMPKVYAPVGVSAEPRTVSRSPT